jgi:cytochrome b561
MIGLGWYMNSLPPGPEQFQLYALHKATGLIILALVVVRIIWRLINPAPVLPDTLKPHERVLAGVTHTGLYVLILAMPVTGYIINSASGFPMTLYGLVTVPNLIPSDGDLQDLAEVVHIWLSRLLIAVVFLHLGAALKHHFVLKDDTLLRMLPFARQSPKRRN